MLVLTRSRNQTIRVGDDILIRVVGVNGGQVRLGVEAPRNVNVDREEVFELKRRHAAAEGKIAPGENT